MKVIIYFTIYIFFPVHLFAQENNVDKFNWSAEYKLSYKLDSNSNKLNSEYMILMFNENLSGFRSVSRYLRDSITATANFKSKARAERMAIYSKYPSNFEEYIVTNLENKNIVFTTVANLNIPTSPKYNEKISPKWTIKKETKKIQNIQTTKAEINLFGRKWIAWFSNEHPFPFGPYKFFGLPGLILDMEDSTKSYHYELINLKKDNIKYARNPFKDVLTVTKAKCMEMVSTGKYTTALFKDVKIDGKDDGYLKQMQIRLDEKKKRENNPIELKP